MPTREEIANARTGNGGWTKKQLAAWGVPWPPPKGWKKALEGGQPVAAALANPALSQAVQDARDILEWRLGPRPPQWRVLRLAQVLMGQKSEEEI
jgi:hypothetical protein